MKVREKRSIRTITSNAPSGDGANDVPAPNADDPSQGRESKLEEEEEIMYEEDPTSEEGAVQPLVEGKIVNWTCFLALLTHVYNTLSPPFHTPILVLSQPCWTAQDREDITKFFFEKFKTPAFCLMDAALAVSYAYATPTATVVDVGYSKCDITTISEHVVGELGRATAIPGSGGEAMTQRLLSLLSAKGFSRDMCEQLKKSSICEALPPGTELPTDAGPEDAAVNPASAASTGAVNPGEGQRLSVAAQGGAPRGPGFNTDVGEAEQEREEDEGILDVATIVASGKTSEFVAKKEREKAEKAQARKNAAVVAAAEKQAKLPNSKRARATFQYLERNPLSDPSSGAKQNKTEHGVQDTSKPETGGTLETAAAARKEERKEERRRNQTFVRKEAEVGLERFQAASGGILDRIADSIHRCILSVPEVNMRSELWNALVIVGNGSRVKGFKEALLTTLNARYLISPNSATIFTSELPSNFTTPVATGANTPQPQMHHPGHHPSGVNPLLHAATTASLAPPGPSQQQMQMQQYQQQYQQSHSHSSHAQTPSSIKTLKAPEYFPEWKEAGMEEASFLGAQVAAKVVFVVDQGISKGFMSRTEYNELGPSGIHENCI